MSGVLILITLVRIKKKMISYSKWAMSKEGKRPYINYQDES